MSNTRYKTPMSVLKLAKAEMQIIRAERAEYEKACRLDWENGFRAHYCPHGMNMWTDYDPICGYCEEGISDYQLALASAWKIWKLRDERVHLIVELSRTGLPRDKIDELYNWAFDLS